MVRNTKILNNIFPKIVSVETIQGRKLYKEQNYSRKYGNCSYKTKLHLFIYKIMMRHFNDNSIEIGYVNILESTQWKVFGIALTTQWRVCTNGLERTTNQANSSCFYFRILWVLMERPWFFSKSFNVETSGALQKPKGMIHKENKVLKLIFMNLWSRNNLDKLDWLTHLLYTW